MVPQPAVMQTPVQAPRRQRRQQARRWLKLGQPEGEKAAGLSRAERRRRLRALMATDAHARRTLVRGGLVAVGCTMALRWLKQEREADRLCGGPKGKHHPKRTGFRHAYELGSVPVGGQRVEILRPRVRTADRTSELSLGIYELAQDEGFLSEAVLAQTLAGVAQRRYRVRMQALTPLGGEMTAGSDSKSAVTRRFVAETQAGLEEWLARPLSGERYLALVVDGLELGAHHVIAALGVTATGEKRVLGLWEGATENTEVCRALLEDLVRRGLSTERGLLVVIDGGKGRGAAVRAVLGNRALVQRCTCHKARNVLDKLPAHRRDAVHRALRRAWSAEDAMVAEGQLRGLIRRLEGSGEVTAAHSLAEGLEETLTCVRLGLHPDLRASLESTHLIESAFSRHEGVAHRVKRWRNGNQALRWAAASLALAEQGFHRLPGADHLETLAMALERRAQSVPTQSQLSA